MESEEEQIVLTKEERELSYQLDAEILRERVVANVELTPYIRKRIDEEQYKKAKRRMYYEAAKRKNPEAVKEYSRASYYKHKEHRRQQQKQYYEANRTEILEQKQGYYQTNRDEILQKMKDRYVAHPVEASDEPIAMYNNWKSSRHYNIHKDEISAKRKAKRQEIKEMWKNMANQTFTMNNGTKQELYVIKQKNINFSATGIGYRISQVVDMTSTPLSIGKTGVTFPFRYVYEEIDLTTDNVTYTHFISLNTIRKNHKWFLLEEQEE